MIPSVPPPRMFRRTLSLLCCAIVLLGAFLQPASATKSWDVYNIPPTRLKVRITSTQSEPEIKLNPPVRNEQEVSWPALSGGVLLFEQGTRTEHIYFSRAIVDADKVVTLTGTIIRDLPWNSSGSFTTGGNGQFFTPGAAVHFVDDARLFNLKANKDRPNHFNNSGAIICVNTRQGCLVPGSWTTAQRDAFTFKQASMIIRNSTLGALQYYDGSTWLTIATQTGSFVNATQSVAGKVQIASTGAILARTATGSTGAENVLSARYTTASGGLAARGKVMVVDDSGFASGALLGTDPDSNEVLYGDQRWATIAASGAALYSASHNSDVTISSTSFGTINAGLDISVFTNVGSILEMNFTAVCRRGTGAGNVSFDYQIGNGMARSSASGSLTIDLVNVNDDEFNASFAAKIKSATGGLMTVGPRAKVHPGQTNFTCDAPIYSEITVHR